MVNRHGGRVVKLIGDAVMFTAPSIERACTIAFALIGEVANHANLPTVRAGVAAGEVLVRHGDTFGPVVNLAARLVDHAEPGAIAAPVSERDRLVAAGFAVTSPRAVEMRGFYGVVTIVAVGNTASISGRGAAAPR